MRRPIFAFGSAGYHGSMGATTLAQPINNSWSGYKGYIMQAVLEQFAPRRLIGLDERYGVSRTLDALRRRPRTEKVIQDVEIPADRVPEFLEFLDEQTNQRPVWLCPFRVRDGGTLPILINGETYAPVT